MAYFVDKDFAEKDIFELMYISPINAYLYAILLKNKELYPYPVDLLNLAYYASQKMPVINNYMELTAWGDKLLPKIDPDLKASVYTFIYYLYLFDEQESRATQPIRLILHSVIPEEIFVRFIDVFKYAAPEIIKGQTIREVQLSVNTIEQGIKDVNMKIRFHRCFEELLKLEEIPHIEETCTTVRQQPEQTQDSEKKEAFAKSNIHLNVDLHKGLKMLFAVILRFAVRKHCFIHEDGTAVSYKETFDVVGSAFHVNFQKNQKTADLDDIKSKENHKTASFFCKNINNCTK